jgi:outer membrane protein TolC
MNYNMRFLKSTGLVLALSAGALQLNAQAGRSLTLEEAIDLGVQNSKQLRISQARVDAATVSLKQAKERRLPEIGASGSYLRVTKPTISMLYNANSGDNGSGSGSGGSEGSSTVPKVDQAMYVMANASLPLFDGFKTRYAIESARYVEQASRLDAETDRQAVIQNLIGAYTNLYKANASVELVRENLRQTHQRTVDFTNMEKNGLLARNDLLKAQLQESNIQLALLDAESSLKTANTNMDLLLGLPEETVLSLDSNSFTPKKETQNLSYWEETAFSNRSDAKSVDLHAKAAVSNIKSARGGYYPTLKLSGGYVALNVPNFIRVSDAWNGGVGVSYSVSSLWKTPTAVAAAKAQLQEVEASRDLLADNIKLEVSKAYEDYLLSLKKIDVYAEAVEQANENYRIVKNKHENSLATTTDLLDANVDQLMAKLNHDYSKADAEVAYNKLLQASGTLKTIKK